MNIRAIILSLSMVLFSGTLPLFSGELNFDIPEVKKHSTGNGVKLFYIKDDLPKTTIYVSVGYGRIYENSKTAGLGDILANVLKRGGSQKYPGRKMAEVLENIGGEISISSGWERSYISLKVLSRYTDLACDVLKDLLENPRLNSKSLEFTKNMMKERLRRNMDSPDYRAFLKTREIIYGGDGYGAVLTESLIDKVTINDLEKVMKKYFVSGNVNVAVSSYEDFSIIKKRLEIIASVLPAGKRIYYSADRSAALENIKNSRGKVFLVPMKLKQATIVKGTVAPDNRYEGKYALDVMNYILGGGSFTSRLMTEVRVKRGFAYSVFSLVRNRYKTGIFLSFAQTRNSNVGNVLSLFDSIFRGMYETTVSEGELNAARGSILNSFIFKFTRTSQVVANFLDLEYNGLDESYYNDYLQGIRKVRPADITGESRKLLQNGTVTVVVGDISLKDKLKKYGEVVIVK